MELIPDIPCVHTDGPFGVTLRTCTTCKGALTKAPYRQKLVEVGYHHEVEVENRRDCELCKRRGATKGNRVFVRLPRPPRKAWGQDVPPYPPSFEGPLLVGPRIFKATHRVPTGPHKGKHSCDRCDPKGRKAVPANRVKETKGRFKTAADIFG